MRDLAKRLAAHNALLATYAVPYEGTLGREHNEQEDDMRLPFQRDLGRIIHARSFRRLKGKTQVFVAGEGDHYRTRLTHTMEVAQISRDIARTLELNEDLAECIALAHDLGHPPFGHSGEEALNEWMQTHDSSFEHNRQSLRIVTKLEYHSSEYNGLNLNREVLEGLMKHRTPHDQPVMHVDHSPTLEAQIVNIADEIAYTAHDCDDGLREGLFSAHDLTKVKLAAIAKEHAQERGTSIRGAIIHYLVTDLYQSSAALIVDSSITSLEDVYGYPNMLVEFSESVREELDELRSFLWDNMYMHPKIVEKSTHGKRVVKHLCDHYMNSPNDKVLSIQEISEEALHEAVKDHVSGMTDRYALELFNDQE